MNNYNLENYTSTDALTNAFQTEASIMMAGIKVSSEKFGDGEILSMGHTSYHDLNRVADILAEVKFGDIVKLLSFNIAFVERKSVQLPEDKQGLIDEIAAGLADLAKAYEARFAEERRKAAEERAAKLQAEEDAKKELKKELRMKKMIANRDKQKERLIARTDAMSKKAIKQHSTNEYYYALGYIAKHAKKIHAAMPDYLEGWFVKEFGDVERRIVDSTKVGAAGWVSQWTLSMVIDLDTNENIPASLVQYLSDSKKEIKSISNTQFVFDLMRDSGLKFGKKQDVDAIIDEIPNQFLESFKLGYEA